MKDQVAALAMLAALATLAIFGVVGTVSEDAVQGPTLGPQEVRTPDEVLPGTQGTDTGGAAIDVTPVGSQLSAEEERLVAEIQKSRQRLHDVPDERFEQVVQALRNRQSVRSVARELIEEGYCAHLNPTTVRVYVMHVRDALGLPGYREQAEAIDQISPDDISENPIEAQPALRRLRWLARKQHARVRKSLNLEGRMGGMVLPMATTEVKLMHELLRTELEVSIRTGTIRQPDDAPGLDKNVVHIEKPAEALRVVEAYERFKKQSLALLSGAPAADSPAPGPGETETPGAVSRPVPTEEPGSTGTVSRSGA